MWKIILGPHAGFHCRNLYGWVGGYLTYGKI